MMKPYSYKRAKGLGKWLGLYDIYFKENLLKTRSYTISDIYEIVRLLNQAYSFGKENL